MLITENGKAEKWKTIRSGCMSNPMGLASQKTQMSTHSYEMFFNVLRWGVNNYLHSFVLLCTARDALHDVRA